MKKINYKGFWSMLALMFGFTIFSASMLTGGNIGQTRSISTIVLSIVLGNLFLAVYGGFMAYISKLRRRQLDKLAEDVYGKWGSYVLSMVMTLSQMGWFGVGVAMIADPLEQLTGVNHWVFIVVATVAIITTAFFGIKSLTIISMIAVPLVIIAGLVAVGMGVHDGSHVNPGDVIPGHFNPDGTAATLEVHSMNFVAGISMVIGTFISGATFVPNFAPHAKTVKSAVVTTSLAFFVGNGLMIGFGIAGSYLFGIGNLVDAMTGRLGIAALGIIMLILNIWTTNDSGLFSISMGMQKMFKIPKKFGVIIFGLIGMGASWWLYGHFMDFLSAMNMFIPAFGAIFIVDHFVRKYKHNFYKGVNIPAIASWLIASVLMFIPEVKPYAPLVSMAIAAALYTPVVLWENNKGLKLGSMKVDWMNHPSSDSQIDKSYEII